MIEKLIIRFGLLFGVIFFPTLFKKPSYKLWIPLFLWEGIVNHLLNTILVNAKWVRYPVRFMPKLFKINFVYDYLVCPYLSIWFCQSTYHDKFSGVLKKVFLWAVPQALYEILLENKTNALEFKKGYRWYHSLILVFFVKLQARGTFGLLKLFLNKPVNRFEHEHNKEA